MKTKFTMIIKTVPEISKRDGTVYTCSIGYSEDLGFIRVYPLPLTGMKRWGVYEIELERNPRDGRKESWKLSSYARFENFVGFEKDVVYLGDADKTAIIKKMQMQLSPAISVLNNQRHSIGFIQTPYVNAFWSENEKYVNTNQMDLFNTKELSEFGTYTKESKLYESRIRFADGDGGHNLQLNDWQYFEYQRKFGAKPEAFRYVNDNKSKILLIGNMHNYRSKWICLGVFTPKGVLQQNVANSLILDI